MPILESECDSKANLSQKAKGFALLLLLTRETCDRTQALTKYLGIESSTNVKKICYLKLLKQVQSLTSSAKMQNPQIYFQKIGQILTEEPKPATES